VEYYGSARVFTGYGITPPLALSAAALFSGKGIYAYGLSLLKSTFLRPVFHLIRNPWLLIHARVIQARPFGQWALFGEPGLLLRLLPLPPIQLLCLQYRRGCFRWNSILRSVVRGNMFF